jgi:tetratricopeptide (TPR) repeat protein
MHTILPTRNPLTTVYVLVTSFIVFCHPQIADACLWIYGTNAHGRARVYGGKRGSPIDSLKSHRKPKSEWETRKRELQAQLPNGDYKVRNDYAAVLVHLGRSAEALEILKNIETEKPGKYETAANIGTAYELLGDNVSALKWIKEGIKRNPDSHGGSEWVHVKILEAKIQLATDPDWLKTHSVLGLDFGSELAPKKPKREMNPRDPRLIKEAIKYQLQERLQFVTAPNPIVADLLSDFANLIALNDPLEDAIPVYRFSLEFKPVRVELIEKRVSHFEELVKENPHSGKHDSEVMAWRIRYWGGWIAAMVVVFVMVLFILKRRSRRQARYDDVSNKR